MSETHEQTSPTAGDPTPGLHADHITPLRTYLLIGATLAVLTAITVMVAQVDFGHPWINMTVAILIAVTKATLVALFFMHLLHDNKLFAAFFIGSVAFLGLFIVVTMFDTQYRTALYAEQDGAIQQRARIYGEDGKPLKEKAHGEDEQPHGEAEQGHGEDQGTQAEQDGGGH